MKQVLYIVGILALAALAAGAAYFYQQERVDNLTAERDSLSRNLNANQNEGETPDDAAPEEDNTTYVSEKGTSVTVTAPRQRTAVTSPIRVAGTVPGPWSHEAQFTVRLLGANSVVVAESVATLEGEWMTEEQVPFTATLTFDEPVSGAGMLELVKANASGLDEHADSVHVPVILGDD